MGPSTTIRRDQVPLYQEGDVITLPEVKPTVLRKSLSPKPRLGAPVRTPAQGQSTHTVNRRKALQPADVQADILAEEIDDEADEKETDDLPDDLDQVPHGRRLSPSVRHRSTTRYPVIQREEHAEPRISRRQHRQVHGMLLVGVGMLLVMLLYSGIFWVSVGILNVSNLANYGPTHTYHLDTQLGSEQSHIIATNIHGTIYVTIIEEQPGGKPVITTYVGPQLITSAWGDQANLDGIVPTVDVQHTQPPAFPMISVHLTGNMDYWHFYGRPTLTFRLIPADKVGGYKVTL